MDNSEIRQRLDEQIKLADCLQRAATPHGKTLVGAEPQLMLLATALATHVDKLREIRDLV